MSDKRSLKQHTNGSLANLLTCIEMPDGDVSERTQATRRIGGYLIMRHLIEGEWNPSYKEEIQEFLGRVFSNATRQGIFLDTVAAEPPISIT